MHPSDQAVLQETRRQFFARGARGLGVAALPDYLVEERHGLVQLFGEQDSIQLDTYFVYPEELKTVARVQVFRDFIVSKAQRWSPEKI